MISIVAWLVAAALAIAAHAELGLSDVLLGKRHMLSFDMLAMSLFLRSAATVMGGYIAASFNRAEPMRQAATFAFFTATVAFLELMMLLPRGPAWYSIAVPVLVIPAALLGGWLFGPARRARA